MRPKKYIVKWPHKSNRATSDTIMKIIYLRLGYKKCSKCNKIRNIDVFGAREKGYLNSWCTYCRRKYDEKMKGIKNAKHREKYKNSIILKEKRKERKKKRLAIPENRLAENLARQLHAILKDEKKYEPTLKTYVGATKEELKEHNELLMTEGMTWDNYGKWHEDHIKPKSWLIFPGCPKDNMKIAFSIWNLQPLWAADNLSKGARYEKVTCN